VVIRPLPLNSSDRTLAIVGAARSSLSLTPANGAHPSTWTARSADGHTWTLYQGSVSADEQRLYVSYHGPDITGLDWFDATPEG